MTTLDTCPQATDVPPESQRWLRTTLEVVDGEHRVVSGHSHERLSALLPEGAIDSAALRPREPMAADIAHRTAARALNAGRRRTDDSRLRLVITGPLAGSLADGHIGSDEPRRPYRAQVVEVGHRAFRVWVQDYPDLDVQAAATLALIDAPPGVVPLVEER